MPEESAAATKKKATVYTPVQMTDGRTVQFPGETKATTTNLKADGSEAENASEVFAVRFDFRNGETRRTSIEDLQQWGLFNRSAIHGATQKQRDVYAGDESVDDAVESFDELAMQLRKGLWSERREGGGPGGSILLRALVEASGKTAEEVREILSTFSAKEKQILRNTDELRPIIQRLEAAKASPADTASVLSRAGL